MKQFKDLTIAGPHEGLLRLIDIISTNLPTGWCRDLEVEKGFAGNAGETTDAGFAFSRDAKDGDPKIGLLLAGERGDLRVTNIVPRDAEDLSMEQYNRILDEFTDVLCTHLWSDSQLKIRITSDNAAITEWISGEAADLLQQFSNLANMSTGSGHPLDFSRWARFLIQAHKESSTLQSHFLSRWLVEQLGWPPDRANDLVREYEFARDLLRAYDRS